MAEITNTIMFIFAINSANIKLKTLFLRIMISQETGNI